MDERRAADRSRPVKGRRRSAENGRRRTSFNASSAFFISTSPRRLKSLPPAAHKAVLKATRKDEATIAKKRPTSSANRTTDLTKVKTFDCR